MVNLKEAALYIGIIFNENVTIENLIFALAIVTASFFEARRKDIVDSATLLGNAQIIKMILSVSPEERCK